MYSTVEAILNAEGAQQEFEISQTSAVISTRTVNSEKGDGGENLDCSEVNRY